MTDIDTIENVLFYTQVILGSLVFIFNFAIFCILVTKTKKKATDTLVLTNLFMDALYGLLMSCVQSTFVKMDNIDTVFVSLTYYIEDSLIFFSLAMLVLMTLNRYYAVVRPVRYKIYFKKSNVYKMLFGVSLLTLIVFFVLSIPFWKKIAGHLDDRFQYNFLVSLLIWYPIQLVLDIIVAIIMVVIYRSIAITLGENFWTPLMKTIRSGFRILMTKCDCFRNDRNENLEMVVITETKTDCENSQFQVESTISTNQNEEEHKNLLNKTGDDSCTNQVEQTSSSAPGKISANSNSQKRTESFESRSGSGNADQKSSEFFLSASQCRTDTERSRLSSTSSTFSKDPKKGCDRKISTEKVNDKTKQNRRITSSFFFVGFSFIVTAIPTSVFIILLFVLAMATNNWDLVLGSYMSQILYGTVFLINPFLYMFSNHYVMEKLKRVTSQIVKKLSKYN